MLNDTFLGINAASDTQIKAGTQAYRPVVPNNQHGAVFYGLAKAAGDNTQSASNNAIGTYTADAKSAIQSMLGVPGDVQINGTTIVNNGTANIPVATSSQLGVVKTNGLFGTQMISQLNALAVSRATDSDIKAGDQSYKPVTPYSQHESTFYGLSKVAGVDLASETVTTGTYPDSSKAAIQHMLGIDDLVAPNENTLTASKAYAINDVFTANGKLYKATAAITQDAAIVPAVAGEEVVGANCEEIKIGDYFAQKRDTVLETTLSLGRKQDTTIGTNSVTLGTSNTASGKYSLAANQTTYALGQGSFASGQVTYAIGVGAHTEGRYTAASGTGSHAEGCNTITSIKLTGDENTTTYTFNSNLTTDNVGDYLYGSDIVAKIASVDELNKIVTTNITFGSALSNSTIYLLAANARGVGSHIEGQDCRALNTVAHAEGYKTIASGIVSHSENAATIASGSYSHAEGNMTVASGQGSHSEGCITIANGINVHASGQANVAPSFYNNWVENTSYSVGDKVTRNGYGYICLEDNSDAEWITEHWKALPSNTDTALIVGNGTADNARSNAYALDWSGNGHFMGDVYVGANADSTGGTKLATTAELGLKVVRLI